MTDRRVPGTLGVLLTLARVTLRRLVRSRSLWVSFVIASSPVWFALAMGSGRRGHAHGWLIERGEDIFVVQLLVLAVLPSMFVAASIGEEIEDRTTTYLWSRPLARWTIVAGKLLALAPIAMALTVGGWIVAIQLGLDRAPSAQTMVGLGAGALAMSMVAAGIATLVPKHGMALTIVYVLFFDLPIGEIPASLQILSVTHQTKLLAGFRSFDETVTTASEPAIALAVLAGIWLAIGLWRIRRLES